MDVCVCVIMVTHYTVVFKNIYIYISNYIYIQVSNYIYPYITYNRYSVDSICGGMSAAVTVILKAAIRKTMKQ